MIYWSSSEWSWIYYFNLIIFEVDNSYVFLCWLFDWYLFRSCWSHRHAEIDREMYRVRELIGLQTSHELSRTVSMATDWQSSCLTTEWSLPLLMCIHMSWSWSISHPPHPHPPFSLDITCPYWCPLCLVQFRALRSQPVFKQDFTWTCLHRGTDIYVTCLVKSWIMSTHCWIFTYYWL